MSADRRKPSACSYEPRAIGPVGGRPQGDPRLARQRVGFGRLARVLVGREVVAGQRARELVGPERLEEPGRGEMARLPVATGERVVGDLADERLDERVLAALRAARVEVLGQQLAADQLAEHRFEVGLGDARTRRPGRPG